MRQYNHKEAFCLMWYVCEDCGHRERIWNSRDGLTPFGTGCPSCGGYQMLHADWHLDERKPNHTLHRGQRFWRDGTLREARATLQRRFAIFHERGQPVPPEHKAALLADLEKPSDERSEFRDGWPYLDQKQ